MKPKVVSNSTPLIALSKLNKLHILKDLFGSIIIPDAVFFEVANDQGDRAGKHEVLTATWIQRKKVINEFTVNFLKSDLDPGEAEAITLAKEVNANLLLIDDKDGRKTAKSAGVIITGTVGILLRYYRGNPEYFKLSLDELIAKGFRLSQHEYQKMLELAR